MESDPRLLTAIGPEAFGNRDASWFSRQKQKSLESIASGAMGLVGVLLLGWPALGMMLFLIISLWIGLLTDLARALLFPDALRASLDRRRSEEHLWAQVRTQRRGLPPPRETRPLPGGPGLQLGLAFWIALAFTGALIHETARVSGTDLIASALRRPDMLGAMGLLLLAQMVQAVIIVRRQGALEPALEGYTPILDVVMFVILMFFWMIISAIVVKLGEVTGNTDPGAAAVKLFVLVGYALLLWRGCAELRELKELKADSRWLRAKLEIDRSVADKRP